MKEIAQVVLRSRKAWNGTSNCQANVVINRTYLIFLLFRCWYQSSSSRRARWC